MSRYLTVNKPCARCTRVDTEVVSLQDARKRLDDAPKEPQVMAAFRPSAPGAVHQQFRLEELCSVCEKIVHSYLERAFRKIDKVSAARTSKDGAVVEEVEVDES